MYKSGHLDRNKISFLFELCVITILHVGKIKRDISMLRQLVQNYKLNDGSSSYTVHVISLDDAISTSSILSGT